MRSKLNIIGSSLLGLMLGLNGCTLATLHNAQELRDLSPEQINAIREANMDIYACFQIGGPPPVGNTTFIIMPKDTMFTRLAFLPNCQIDMR